MINYLFKINKKLIFGILFITLLFFTSSGLSFASETSDSTWDSTSGSPWFGSGVNDAVLLTGGYQPHEARLSFSWDNYYPRGPINTTSNWTVCFDGPGLTAKCIPKNFPTPNYPSSEGGTVGLSNSDFALYDTASFSALYNTPYGEDGISDYRFDVWGRKASIDKFSVTSTSLLVGGQIIVDWETDWSVKSGYPKLTSSNTGVLSCSPSNAVIPDGASTCTGISAGTVTLKLEVSGPGNPNTPPPQTKTIYVSTVPAAGDVDADLEFNGNPGPTITVTSGTTGTLGWSVDNAVYCEGSWVGSSGGSINATGGTFSTGPITTSRTYTIYCENAGDTDSDTDTLTINVSGSATASSCSGIILYRSADYTGTCESFTSNQTTLSNNTIDSDTASSLKVPNGSILSVYEHDDYGGRCETFTGNDSDLTNNYIGNNTISSLKIGTNCPATQSTLNVNSTNVSGVAITRLSGTAGTGSTTPYTFISASSISTVLQAPASVSGSNFSSWTGCDSVGGTGNRDCTVTVSALATKTITANYASAVNGVCGTANKTYPSTATSFGSDTFCTTGTPSITPAFPASGSSVNWACLGTGGGANSGQCTASRSASGFTLTVAANPGPGGSVSSFDGLINCGSSCSATYSSGDSVTLQATPTSSYWQFNGWTGDCSGTGLCILTINAPKSVTALFGPRDFDYTEF